jgi:hypothetical protein
MGEEKLYVRGSTYGAFRPDADGDGYHDLDWVPHNFALMSVPPRCPLWLSR